MDDKEILQAKLETLRQIDKDDLNKPHHIPVNVYVEEADALYRWSGPDKERLLGVGLSEELLEDLPARTAALREAQSVWTVERLEQKEAEKQWDIEYQKAKDLYTELIVIYRFALRSSPGGMKSVKRLEKGRKQIASFFQGLSDLGYMGTYPDYEPLLKAVNFDGSLAEQASQMSDDLPTLHAEKSGLRKPEYTTVKLRDQAYTHLKEAVDEVRKYGKFLFYRDPERMVGYRSAHIRKKTIQRLAKERDVRKQKKEAETKTKG